MEWALLYRVREGSVIVSLEQSPAGGEGLEHCGSVCGGGDVFQEGTKYKTRVWVLP